MRNLVISWWWGWGEAFPLYVSGHDRDTIRKLVRFFQYFDFAGVIFSRIHIGGTFLLKQVRLDVPNAPDLLVSLRWNSGTNKFGVPGLLVAESGKPGRGYAFFPEPLRHAQHLGCCRAGYRCCLR